MPRKSRETIPLSLVLKIRIFAGGSVSCSVWNSRLEVVATACDSLNSALCYRDMSSMLVYTDPSQVAIIRKTTLLA